MTEAEFREWYDHHRTNFPELDGWLLRNTPKDAPEEKRPLRAWSRVMASVPLGKAKAASDAMLAGDIPDPKGFSKHPAAIIAYCRAGSSSEPTEDTRFPPCACNRGYLDVIDAEGFSCVVLCTCAAGDHRAACHERIGAKPMRRFKEGDRLE